MSHTNSTTNYNLPQFITTDKPAWLTDVNNAYSAIDIGIHAAKTAADSAQSDATLALTNAGTAQTTANTASSTASGAIASISEDFIDSATYSVGDLVIYNNLLYKCHTAVVVPGAWTGSANWSRTDMDSIIKNFSLNDLANTVIGATSAGQTLVRNSSNTAWINQDNTLNNLTNVTIGTTASNDLLMRNNSNTAWVNAPALSLIKTKILENTTSTSGAITHGLDLTKNIILYGCGYDNNNINRYAFLRSSSDDYVTVFQSLAGNNPPFYPLVNTAVKIMLYYI